MGKVLNHNQTFATPGEALEHHGVKGMRWGFRKKDKPVGDKPTYESTVDGAAIGSPITKMDKTVHTSSQDAAYIVTAKLKERYGYEVKELRAIEDKRKFKNYIAYVDSDPKKNSTGVIHVQAYDMTAELKKIEDRGWFGKDAGNMTATMTHETAHSMFHVENMGVNSTSKARDAAWEAALTQAKKDGIKPRNIRKHISGYSNSSLWQEETEAELFSQYHWQKNPPRFIKEWGRVLHEELGVDPTPFREDD